MGASQAKQFQQRSEDNFALKKTPLVTRTEYSDSDSDDFALSESNSSSSPSVSSKSTPSPSSTKAEPVLSDIAADESARSWLPTYSVLMHGLPGSGKTALESQLGLNGVNTKTAHSIDMKFLTTPQIYSAVAPYHPNRPNWSTKKVDASVWKLGGRGSVHAKWNMFAHSSRASILVVDSTDSARLVPSADFTPLPDEFVKGYNRHSKTEQEEIFATLKSQMTVKSMFDMIRKETQYHTKPLLVLATKQDMDGAMSVNEICEKLNLKSITTIDWRIVGVDALTGEGLEEAFTWLNQVLISPSDFKAAKKLAQEQDQNPYVLQVIKRSLKELEEEYRKTRLARGDVLQAPTLYRTDGSIVHATQDQKKEFVVAPLTAESYEDLLSLYEQKQKSVDLYQDSNPEYKELIEQMFSKHLPPIDPREVTTSHSEVDGHLMADSSSSTSVDSASSSNSALEFDSEYDSDSFVSENDSDFSLAPSTVTHTPQPASPKQQAESNKVAMDSMVMEKESLMLNSFESTSQVTAY